MRIIKLTGLSGHPVYINAAQIATFERDKVEAEGKNSRVVMACGDFFGVRETPAQIVAIIYETEES